MGLIDIIREVPDKEQAVRFLQKAGILHEMRFCPKGHEMKLSLGPGEDKWRCNKSTCRSSLRLRKGTWLESRKLKLEIIVYFLYAWSREYATEKFCSEEFKMGSATTTDWKNCLRKVCAESLLQSQTAIGGEGLTVEVDESVFSRRKYNVGRCYPRQWVLGGVCRETKQCFLCAIPDRSESTLLNVIKNSVRAGSTIVTDSWEGYDGISALPGCNFKHLRVDHSRNFRDPVTGAHTNSVEGLWGELKRRNRRECGTARSLLDSYLSEFMWRRHNKGTDLFERILKDIAVLYPPR